MAARMSILAFLILHWLLRVFAQYPSKAGFFVGGVMPYPLADRSTMTLMPTWDSLAWTLERIQSICTQEVDGKG